MPIKNSAEKIKHVVVLMLENRSFDHMLGDVQFTKKVAQADAGKHSNKAPDGAPVPVSFDAPAGIEVGPDHGYEGVMLQLLGRMPEKSSPLFPKPYVPDNSGFIANFEERSGSHEPKHVGYGVNIMKCQPRANVSVLGTLAQSFAVCDHWFSSVPGQTWPNRNYAHAGTSDGEVDIKKRNFTNDTIFDRLDEARKKWMIYHDGIPQVWVYSKLWWDVLRRRGFRSIDRFKDDVAKGDLLEYTFIEPRHFGKKANSQHPENKANERSFYAGEALIKTVYDTLRDNETIWKSTLLIITYDEHGGFYDHVPPPTGKTAPDKKHSKGGFEFDMYGVRVPCVLVSPWIEAGRIDSRELDHTAIPKSVRERFAPATRRLSLREEASPSVWENLTLTKARTDRVVVEVSASGRALLKSEKPLSMTVAATKTAADAPAVEGLPDEEEPYAWLAYNVARGMEQARSGAAAPGTLFFEDVTGRLITKKTDADEYRSSAIARSISGARAPVIITDSDTLSAFGNSVAEEIHASAEAAKTKPRALTRRKRRT